MTYDNPLRPSGHEAYDIGTVIRFKGVDDEPGSRRYEYVGVYNIIDARRKHVMRDHEDGILYETTNIDQFEVAPVIPEPGQRWSRNGAGNSTYNAVIKGVVDFDDGVGPLVAYIFDDGGTGIGGAPFLRPLAKFLETYTPA